MSEPEQKHNDITVISGLEPGEKIEKSKVHYDPIQGLRAHNYYSAINALDFLAVIRKWKEMKFENIVFPSTMAGIKAASLKLRLLCSRQYLMDNPHICQDVIEHLDAAEVKVSGKDVMLVYRRKVTAESLLDIMMPATDTKKTSGMLAAELIAWIQSNPKGRDQFVRLKLDLSPTEMIELQAILDRYKTHFTGVIKFDRLVVVRLTGTAIV